jgi:MoaA/NifB/PqqE/SkfB family radical SAM enzyme
MIPFLQRVRRHLRLTWAAKSMPATPPFLTLFINSICNMQCEHCFYWQNLNRTDDLSFDELIALSKSLGKVENLNLSGGEPFLRKEIGAVCREFVRRNGVRQIYIPTNGYFTDRTIASTKEILNEADLSLLAIELSLDGMAEYHDAFRVSRGSFGRAMKTYDALTEIQERDPRLRIHATSTAHSGNIEELRRLTGYLLERCPKMDHHNLDTIRGDRKNPELAAPLMDAYYALYREVQERWTPREQGRFGSSVEPLMQWTKRESAKLRQQVVPCLAGKLSAVVYSNGDVSVCESHTPLGNLRDRSFGEIWRSSAAAKRRTSIAAKECWCTAAVPLWPSIVFQPTSLVRTIAGARSAKN